MIKDVAIGAVGLLLASSSSDPAKSVGAGLIVLAIARATRDPIARKSESLVDELTLDDGKTVG